MTELSNRLYLSQDIKKLEGYACERDQLSVHQLMSRAGQAAFDLIAAQWPNATSLEVCCGVGNNGGDGFIVAQLARAVGVKVIVYQIGDHVAAKASAAAGQARADWLAAGGEILLWEGQAFQADVIVDAILGTGARQPLPTICLEVIEKINQSQRPVLAIDLPSGLDPDSGAYQTVIHATATITFVALKVGLMSGNNFEVVGQLFFDNLGISDTSYPQIQPYAHRLTYQMASALLPIRQSSINKGDNGHVVFIGAGQAGFSGAACLCAESALRAGAGLVSAVVAPESLPLMARGPAEIMCYAFAHPKELADLMAKAKVVILGPGLSQNKWAKAFYGETLKTKLPLVLDADGLNLLAQNPQHHANWVLTPHPGEAGRLLGISTAMVQSDRLKSALALQQKYGGVIVLKGPGTVVVNDQAEIFIQDGGVPALATGGTGDVLAGLIGGLISQGIPAFQAAQIAVSVHVNAGILEQSMGARGMLASDLFLHIRALLNPQG